MKILFESETEAVVNLNVLKRTGFDIRNNLYIGFIAFSRKACGTDFLKAVVDGRLQFGFLDATDIYDPLGAFWRNEGSLSSQSLKSFRFSYHFDFCTFSIKLSIIRQGLDYLKIFYHNFLFCQNSLLLPK